MVDTAKNQLEVRDAELEARLREWVSPVFVEFQQNFKQDVEQYFSVFQAYAASTPGALNTGSLNRAGIVALCAYWESFVEDLLKLALWLCSGVKDPSKLPVALQKTVMRQLAGSKHELFGWRLAGDGWRAVIIDMIKAISDDYAWLNAPRASNIDRRYIEYLGIQPSLGWDVPGLNGEDAERTLERLVALRGAIAHRGRPKERIETLDAVAYGHFIVSLAKETDVFVFAFIIRTLAEAVASDFERGPRPF
jgi:RiboL-PSP-HEPN